MKLNNKYRDLMRSIKSLDEWGVYPDEIKEIVKQLKSLYKVSQVYQRLADCRGRYGIEYKTIHDDSKYAETNYLWFFRREDRDAVYNQWKNGIYWDNEFDMPCTYPPPAPNLHDIRKIHKSSI